MGTDYYLCPGCDREVRVGSRGCPYCHPPAKRRKRPKAAAKRTRRSWESSPAEDGLNLPDDDFDYDDFIAREFGGKTSRRHRLKWYWWLTAVLLLALMVLGGWRLWGG